MTIGELIFDFQTKTPFLPKPGASICLRLRRLRELEQKWSEIFATRSSSLEMDKDVGSDSLVSGRVVIRSSS